MVTTFIGDGKLGNKTKTDFTDAERKDEQVKQNLARIKMSSASQRR